MRDAEQEKANRLYYLGIGRCPRCGGKNKVQDGRVLCVECQQKHDESYRQRRDKWRDEGRCITCGREREDSKMQCRRCLDRAVANRDNNARVAQRRERLKAMGFCITCGQTYAAPGHVSCEKCLAKRRRQYAQKDDPNACMRELREKRRAEGVCIDCGAPTDGIHKRCPKCAEGRRDSTRKYKIKKEIQAEAQRARRRARL